MRMRMNQKVDEEELKTIKEDAQVWFVQRRRKEEETLLIGCDG